MYSAPGLQKETVIIAKIFKLGVVAGLTAAAVTQLQGSQGTGPTSIAGSISFVGHATTDGTDIASATEFTAITAKVENDSGAYALVPSLLGPTPGMTSLSSKGLVNVMTAYAFNPSQGTVTPLWKFTTGGVTYAFDATSLSAVFDSTADAWDISGSGDALISGGGTSYTATPGTWSATVSSSSTAFNFGSAEDPPLPAGAVPDGGVTFAFLGGVLIGISGLCKKRS